MLHSISTANLNYGLILGWHLGRFDIIHSSQEYKLEVDSLKSEITYMLKIENIDFPIDEPIILNQHILRHFRFRDLEKHTALLLGISAFRLSIAKNTNDPEIVDYLENLANSAIKDIDSHYILDKADFFEKFKNNKPDFFEDAISFVLEYSGFDPVKQLSSSPNITIIGEITTHNYMEEYKVTGGNVGAFGRGASAQNFTQNSISDFKQIDLQQLSDELNLLRKKLKEEAQGADEYDAPIGAIANAQEAAKNGDEEGVMKFLKSAGKWALDTATKIGTDVAAKAIVYSLGIK